MQSQVFRHICFNRLEAIRAAQGITSYTDLRNVKVTRKRAKGLGGGRIQTTLNFLAVITDGNESQNIRLYDGDIIQVNRGGTILKDQMLKKQTSLNPQFINVFVGGRVKSPGNITVPQGSTLNQAISIAGGTEFLKGKVEFIRFSRDGDIEKRSFVHSPSAAADTHKNPILQASDLIRVKDSLLTGGFKAFDEITSPFIGIYSVYSLFNGLTR